MIILGMDPGLAISGYGLIEYIGNKFTLIEYGAVLTEAGTPFPERLEHIYYSYMDMLKKYQPDAISIEELFYNNNAKTAIDVAQARGIHILVAKLNNIPIYEYTPLQIKKGVVGYGRAEKKQVQEMVKVFLHMKEIAKPDDAADGLAAAITHANHLKVCENFRVK